jgi:hypothetical protein
MPDTFFAHGSWRVDGDESKINFGVQAIAFIDVQFVRQQGDQYLIEGQVTYAEDTLSCTVSTHPTNCPVNTCAVVSTTPGELTGVAEVRGDKLVINMNWLTEPNENVTYKCDEELSVDAGGWAVRQTMEPRGAGIVEKNWEVDITGMFIDDLPTNEATDTQTISVEASDVTAEGLIGFYREKPE